MKKAITISLLLLPALGFAQEMSGGVAAIKAFEKQAREAPFLNSNALTPTAKINTNAAPVKALVGTWNMSYTVADIRYTDQLVIKEVQTGADGDVFGFGVVYEDIVSPPLGVACKYDPATLSAAGLTGNTFYCITTYQQYQHYYTFGINADNTLSGYYGIGTTAASAINAIKGQALPLIAYREPFECTAAYDTSTSLLNIPCVTYLGTTYSATLKDSGSFTFKLQGATSK